MASGVGNVVLRTYHMGSIFCGGDSLSLPLVLSPSMVVVGGYGQQIGKTTQVEGVLTVGGYAS